MQQGGKASVTLVVS